LTKTRRDHASGGRRGMALAALLPLLLGACAEKPTLSLPSVAIQAEERANDFSPVAVDVVLVRDQKLVEELLKLTAGEWFQKREQMLRDHPGTLSAHSWEVVPGQALTKKLPAEPAAWAGLVFANYGKGGPHRLRVADAGPVAIRLGETAPAFADPNAPAADRRPK
jgi:type VI secretion system protein